MATLKKIMGWSDGYTDEVQTNTLALSYANKAIARLNTQFKLSLPFIEDVTAEYDALNESWFVRIMLAQLSYGIKMNDGARSEAQEYKDDYERCFYELSSYDLTTIIPEEFLGNYGSEIVQIDTSNAIDIGWFYPGGGLL